MSEELERKIVRSLNQDARKSYREIAKDVGTSATAVMNTIRRLEARGAIKGYVPVVDPAQFGYDLDAVIALRISQGKLLETQKKIAAEPQVAAVFDITGEWDSLVIARFKGRDDLNRFLKKVTGLPFVDRTATHIVLNTVKDDRRLFV
jgi:DNA-binding Lrp family transcriptional regulator